MRLFTSVWSDLDMKWPFFPLVWSDWKNEVIGNRFYLEGLITTSMAINVTLKDRMAYFDQFLKRILPWLKFIMLTYLWTKSDICSFASLTIIFIQRIIETAKFWAGPWAEPFWSEKTVWIKLEELVKNFDREWKSRQYFVYFFLSSLSQSGIHRPISDSFSLIQ